MNNIPSNSRNRLISELLQQDVHELEIQLKGIVKNYDQLLEYLTLLGSKPPAIITMAAEYILTSEIIKKLEDFFYPDINGIKRDFEIASYWQVKPDEDRLHFVFSDCINEMLTGMCMSGFDIEAIEDLNDLISLFNVKFQWPMNLDEAQNLYYELLKQHGARKLKQEPEQLRNALYKLGRALKFSDEMLKVLK